MLAITIHQLSFVFTFDNFSIFSLFFSGRISLDHLEGRFLRNPIWLLSNLITIQYQKPSSFNINTRTDISETQNTNKGWQNRLGKVILLPYMSRQLSYLKLPWPCLFISVDVRGKIYLSYLCSHLAVIRNSKLHSNTYLGQYIKWSINNNCFYYELTCILPTEFILSFKLNVHVDDVS